MKNAVMLDDGFEVPLMGDQEKELVVLFQDQLATKPELLDLKKIKPSPGLNPGTAVEPDVVDIERDL